MKEIIENAVVEQVVEDAAPEVIEKAVKLNLKDAGIIGGLIVGGTLAVYGAYTFVKGTVIPKFGKKKNVIDLTEDAEDEAEEE